jgi:transposase
VNSVVSWRKGFRRIATRHDKLARNFLAGIVLAATLTWWI